VVDKLEEDKVERMVVVDKVERTVVVDKVGRMVVEDKIVVVERLDILWLELGTEKMVRSFVKLF